jgi:hypothetical protein
MDRLCGAGNTCKCRFDWNELNTAIPGDSTLLEEPPLSIARTDFTSLKAIQEAVVTCTLPALYSTDIGSGDALTVKIVPATTSQPQFAMSAFTVTRETSAPPMGSPQFTDNRGNAFFDILRYACHENSMHRSMVTPAMSQLSGFEPPHNINTTVIPESLRLNFASRFCVTLASGSLPESTNGGTDCVANTTDLPRVQNHYYSLYTQKGNLALPSSNASFSCPLVAAGAGKLNTALASDLFPMDSRFALAATKSREFPVPVDGRNRLGTSNNSGAALCDGTTPTQSSGIAVACLGFAAKPLVDGSCGSVTVNNSAKKMYRLRRFTAIYPPIYDANGAWITDARAKTDQIYVLDRPSTFSLSATAASVTGTAYGPKPCPFSWYDRTGVTGSVGYKATNHSTWAGKNPDGLRFPSATSACEAMVPRYDESSGTLKISVGKLSDAEAMIRPLQAAWEPIYYEDRLFEACAPEASVLVSAPIHQKQPASKASYCEEIYPTSHRGTTTEGGHLPASGSRKITVASTDTSSTQLPLLAEITGIEKALDQVSSYGCQASWLPKAYATSIGSLFPKSGACCSTASAHNSSCTTP